MADIVTIGSATMDVFVECDDANIVSVRSLKKKSEFMSYSYGAKIEITDFASQVGGGGVNTATNFANLGLSTAAIFKVGDDIYSKGLFEFFKDRDVDLSYVIQNKEESTGFSIILTSFEGDRTVLAHRGANAHIKKSEINYDAIKNAKLLYIAPLNGDSNKVLDDIVKFAKENDTAICFNAGTTGIKKGFNYLKKILESAQIVVMNKEEATLVTKIQVRPDTKEEKYSKTEIHPDVVEMLKALRGKTNTLVVITDGKNGSYCYDGKQIYLCPTYPAVVTSTLGAGDAFSSTFCATIDKYNWDIVKALQYGTINSASVCEHFGAQEGFLTFDEIEEKLKNSPDFKVKVIK